MKWGYSIYRCRVIIVIYSNHLLVVVRFEVNQCGVVLIVLLSTHLSCPSNPRYRNFETKLAHYNLHPRSITTPCLLYHYSAYFASSTAYSTAFPTACSLTIRCRAAWEALPVEYLEELIGLMKRPCAAVILRTC